MFYAMKILLKMNSTSFCIVHSILFYMLNIKLYYWKKPSYKLIKLLSLQNVKHLCNLGKFLMEDTTRREQIFQ